MPTKHQLNNMTSHFISLITRFLVITLRFCFLILLMPLVPPVSRSLPRNNFNDDDHLTILLVSAGLQRIHDPCHEPAAGAESDPAHYTKRNRKNGSNNPQKV